MLRQRAIKEEKQKMALEHEKTLFDFDEEIDDLECIQDRYPVQQNEEEKENSDDKRKEQEKK